jgi:hypothetical protein
MFGEVKLVSIRNFHPQSKQSENTADINDKCMSVIFNSASYTNNDNCEGST